MINDDYLLASAYVALKIKLLYLISQKKDNIFFFNYLLALIGGPTFLDFFLYTDYDITRKKIVSSDENKN